MRSGRLALVMLAFATAVPSAGSAGPIEDAQYELLVNDQPPIVGTAGVPLVFTVPAQPVSPAPLLGAWAPQQTFTAFVGFTPDTIFPLTISISRGVAVGPIRTTAPGEDPCAETILLASFRKILPEGGTATFGFATNNAPDTFLASDVTLTSQASGPPFFGRSTALHGRVDIAAPACPPNSGRPMQVFGSFVDGGGQGFRAVADRVPQPYSVTLDITSSSALIGFLHQRNYVGSLQAPIPAEIDFFADAIGQDAGTVLGLTLVPPPRLNFRATLTEGIGLLLGNGYSLNDDVWIDYDAFGTRIDDLEGTLRIDTTEPRSDPPPTAEGRPPYFARFVPERSARFRLEGLPTQARLEIKKGQACTGDVDAGDCSPPSTLIRYRANSELETLRVEGEQASGNTAFRDRFSFDAHHLPMLVDVWQQTERVLTDRTYWTEDRGFVCCRMEDKKELTINTDSPFQMTVVTEELGERTTLTGRIPIRFYLCTIGYKGCAPDIEYHQTPSFGEDPIVLRYTDTLRVSASQPSSVVITQENVGSGQVTNRLDLTDFRDFAIAYATGEDLEGSIGLDTNGLALPRGQIQSDGKTVSFSGLVADNYGLHIVEGPPFTEVYYHGRCSGGVDVDGFDWDEDLFIESVLCTGIGIPI